jgi:hypothetical protein
MSIEHEHEQTSLKWGNQASQYLAKIIGEVKSHGIWQGAIELINGGIKLDSTWQILLGESSPMVFDRE